MAYRVHFSDGDSVVVGDEQLTHRGEYADYGQADEHRCPSCFRAPDGKANLPAWNAARRKAHAALLEIDAVAFACDHREKGDKKHPYRGNRKAVSVEYLAPPKREAAPVIESELKAKKPDKAA